MSLRELLKMSVTKVVEEPKTTESGECEILEVFYRDAYFKILGRNESRYSLIWSCVILLLTDLFLELGS